MLEWRLSKEWVSAGGQRRPGQARPGARSKRTTYLLPCHQLFHGYPSPEEEACTVGGEIAFRKILYLELLNILDKPSRKHVVFPRTVQCRTWKGRECRLTQCSVVLCGL